MGPARLINTKKRTVIIATRLREAGYQLNPIRLAKQRQRTLFWTTHRQVAVDSARRGAIHRMTAPPNRSHPMTTPISRRPFLQTAAAATFIVGAPAYVRGRDLNSKIDIAVVGCGGRGGGNMGEVAKSEYITALCDVNGKNLAAAAAKHKDARTFTDFRKLFDNPKGFDAVVVSTCEHTHVYPTLAEIGRAHV